MTNEELLKAVIGKQVAGGYDSPYKNCDVGTLIKLTEVDPKTSGVVIAILLDTQGLKAAYPSKEFTIETGDKRKDAALNLFYAEMRRRGRVSDYAQCVAQLILISWLECNNVTLALQTAYDLLPKP